MTALGMSAFVLLGGCCGDLSFVHTTVDGDGPRDMHVKTIGDIDGDRFIDLVAAGSRIGEPLVWYRSPDWARTTISNLGGWSTDAEVGDIDQDGDHDIVISSWYRDDPGLEWFENLGGGQSWSHHILGAPRAHDIELADFDLDGDLDLVSRQQEGAGAAIEFWRQETSALWTHRSLTQGVPPGEGLAVGDMDRDGDGDVVIGGTWYENSRDIITGAWSARTFSRDWTWPAATVAVADINQDNRLDIALAPAESAGGVYRVSWFEAPVDPTAENWTEHVVDPNTESVLHSLGVADMDRDDDLDILVAEMHQSSDPDEIRIYINEPVAGSGLRWTKRVIATGGSHNFRVADFDRDGDADVFGANWSGTRSVDLWRNASTLVGDVVIQPGDANLDGQVDSTDLILALSGGKYETGVFATWQEGDWNGAPNEAFPLSGQVPPPGDGLFNTSDLVATFATGFYEAGPYHAAVAGGALLYVCEPTSSALAAVGWIGLLVLARRC